MTSSGFRSTGSDQSTHRAAGHASGEDDDAPLDPGTMVGEYRIERAIGQGTFGDVYAGVHPVIGKRVAIKVLRRKMAANAEVVARFVAEARAVNQARHRNIVDVFAFGTLGDRHYHVMELLDGLTLGDLLDREKRLTPAQALPILRGIADALDAAHAAGIIHRDLKPENVFLVPDGAGGFTPKLLDFGVAKLLTDEMGVKTATGVAIGTPRYMSPEQARGRRIDHRADIYALGVLTHEALTGDAPFHAEGPVELLIKHTTMPPPRMSSVCPDLPRELDEPVLSMMAKQTSERPASAGKAIAALAERMGATAGVPTQPLGTKVADAPTVREPAPPVAVQAMPMQTVRLDASAGAAVPAYAPVPRTVLLDQPAPQKAPAVAVLAPTMVSAGSSAPVSAPMSAPVSASDLPRSNIGPVVAAIGVLAVVLAAAAFFAFRGPSPAAATSTSPSLVAASAAASVTQAAPPEPVTTVTPGSAAPSSAPPEQPPSAAPSAAPVSRPMPRGTAAPSRTTRDIGF